MADRRFLFCPNCNPSLFPKPILPIVEEDNVEEDLVFPYQIEQDAVQEDDLELNETGLLEFEEEPEDWDDDDLDAYLDYLEQGERNEAGFLFGDDISFEDNEDVVVLDEPGLLDEQHQEEGLEEVNELGNAPPHVNAPIHVVLFCGDCNRPVAFGNLNPPIFLQCLKCRLDGWFVNADILYPNTRSITCENCNSKLGVTVHPANEGLIEPPHEDMCSTTHKRIFVFQTVLDQNDVQEGRIVVPAHLVDDLRVFLPTLNLPNAPALLRDFESLYGFEMAADFSMLQGLNFLFRCKGIQGGDSAFVYTIPTGGNCYMLQIRFQRANLVIGETQFDAARCPICLVYFKQESRYVTPCGHVFHHTCFGPITRCPSCRASIPAREPLL